MGSTEQVVLPASAPPQKSPWKVAARGGVGDFPSSLGKERKLAEGPMAFTLSLEALCHSNISAPAVARELETWQELKRGCWASLPTGECTRRQWASSMDSDTWSYS